MNRRSFTAAVAGLLGLPVALWGKGNNVELWDEYRLKHAKRVRYVEREFYGDPELLSLFALQARRRGNRYARFGTTLREYV